MPAAWSSSADRLRDGDLVWAVYTSAGMMMSDSFNTRYLASRILKASGVLIARDPSLDRKSAEVAVMAIDPYLREGAFLPEATAAMGEAFEAVCNELHLADESKELRALVATRIIAAARQGEIDQFVYERRR
jgi:hypothetical protein